MLVYPYPLTDLALVEDVAANVQPVAVECIPLEVVRVVASLGGGGYILVPLGLVLLHLLAPHQLFLAKTR